MDERPRVSVTRAVRDLPFRELLGVFPSSLRRGKRADDRLDLQPVGR